jgi:hypothetical protein
MVFYSQAHNKNITAIHKTGEVIKFGSCRRLSAPITQNITQHKNSLWFDKLTICHSVFNAANGVLKPKVRQVESPTRCFIYESSKSKYEKSFFKLDM